MGKGQIISGGTGGLYQVKLIYAYRARVEKKIADAEAQIAALNTRIATLDAQITAETDAKKRQAMILERSGCKLQVVSREKLVEYYQTKMPADPTVAAYSMDLTENLSGYVGTAEIPGEPAAVIIRPGYDGRATYSAARDGQLMPPIAGEPNQVLFNWMLLPGWQRHKPIYRIGTIVAGSIDRDAGTCSICLEAAYSSQQSLPAVDGLAISDCGVPSGFTAQINDFCSRNPGHPFCTNTEEGEDIFLTDGMLSDLRAVNNYVNNSYGRGDDASGWRIGDHWDVMSPGGQGDCVACYEEIYTADGLKNVGDLVVGDIVLSYDFTAQSFCYKPILKIWEKGELPGVRVGLKNGHHIDITENHPLWVRSNQSRGRDGNGLRKYEKVYFKDIDLSRWWRRRLPIAVKIPYDVRDIEWLTEGLCLALGHFIAEGWVEGEGCKVSSSGYDLDERIIPVLEAEGVPFTRYANSSGVPCIRILKSRFKDYLKTLKRNSFDIHLPEELFHLPDAKLFRIIEGHFIGDGHIGNYDCYSYESHKQEVFSTSSKQFAYDLQRIGLQLGMSFHLWKQDRHGGSGTKPIYRVTRNGKSHFYQDHGYPGLSEVGIARSRITQLGMVKMRDFEVEGTHTFVFKNGLVAHQCEDFAFTKMQRLVSVYGWNPRDLKLVTSYTRDGVGHAMLGVRTSNRGLMILDVNSDPVVSSSRLEYRIDKIALTKDSWSSYTRRLDAVPVEYMTCNAWAFEDGDRVVVQFANQDWLQPKVVGFADGPQACAFKFYFLCQFTLNCAAGGQIVYDIATDAFRNLGGMISPEFRDRAAGVAVGANIHVAGGYAYQCSGGSPVEVGTVADHDIFNTGTEAWANSVDIPNARTGLIGAGVGGKAYFFGGFSQQHNAKQTVNDTDDCGERVFSWTSFMSSIGPFFDQCSEFDPVAAAWVAKAAITSSRAMLQAFAVAQIIYAAGGVVGQVDDTQNTATCTETGGGTHSYTDLEDQYQFTDDARRYSPLSDAWAAIADLPAARAFHAAANFEAAGFVFGGRSHGSLTADDIEVADSLDGYDQHQTFSAAKFVPSSGAWSTIAKLPIASPDYTPPDNMPAAGSVDGIYVHVYANNFTGSGDFVLFKYAPASDTYQGVGDIQALKDVNDNRGIAGSVGAIL